MTLINKIAGYGAAVAASFAIAVVLLVGNAGTAQAAVGTAALTATSIQANGTQTITITDADIGAGTDYVVLSISGVSLGTARFTQNSGQSIVVFNGGTGDTDAAVNGTIVVSVTGQGGAGAVVVNGNLYDGTDGLDGAAPDGDQFNAAWDQTNPTASIQLVSTVTGIPATPVAGTANTQAVLSAIVTTTSGTAVPASTVVTFQAVGAGVFTDTVTAASTVAAAAGGGAYDAAAAGNSGCIAGEGLQSCTAGTGFANDGEVIATAETTTGTASVTFEGAGVTGTTTITATVGTVSSSITITVYGTASTVTLSRTGTGTTIAAAEFIRANGVATGNVVVTIKDAAGNPVANHIPTFAVTVPTVAGAAVTLAGAANGTVPSCAAGTNTNGQCNILVTSTTTQGLNTIRVRAANHTTASPKEATIDVTLVGAAATVTIDESVPSTVKHLSTTTVIVNVLDAEGDPAPDGTACAIAATGTGVITAAAPTTVGGKCTTSLVSGSVDGVIQLVAGSGTLTPAQKTITVAGTEAPAGGGDGTLTAPTFGSGNIGAAVFSGGTIEQLVAQVTAAGGTSVWVQDSNGTFRVYGTTAPAFVNASFNTVFADGFAGPTAVTVVK